MANATRRADGLIERCRTIDGHKRHFYGKTAREVQAKIDAALADARQRQQKGDLFRDVAEKFWRDKEPRIKYGTRRGYRHKVDLAVSGFGSVGMREISATDISRELQHMARQGSSYKTIANQKSVLSLIWQFWCSEMGGDANPVTLLRLPQGLPQKKRHPPTEDEVRLVRQHPEGFGLCPALMMYAGLRLGEVMALQRQDIQGDEISVSKAVVWHSNAPAIEAPKTENAVRVVPVLAPLKPLLEAHLQDLKPTDYLFGGAEPLTKSKYEAAWLRYCTALGCVYDTGRRRATGKTSKDGKPLEKKIMAATFTAHQLRHEYASVLVECGIPETVAKSLMGHADIMTTKRWYAEAKQSNVAAAKDILDKYFEGRKEAAGA